MVDNLRQEFGINIFTNLAATRVLDTSAVRFASGATADTIKQENAAVQVMFQVSDMFATPVLIHRGSGKVLDNTESGRLATRLAALAEVASGLSMGVASPAAIADDLTDGRLDSIGSSRMQAGLDAAIGKVRQRFRQASLTDAAANTNLVTDAATAGIRPARPSPPAPPLQQARQIFADLRTSILSIANDAGTGSLDQQNALMQGDFQHGVDAVLVIDHPLADGLGCRHAGQPQWPAGQQRQQHLHDSVSVHRQVLGMHLHRGPHQARISRHRPPAANGVTWEFTASSLETGASTPPLRASPAPSPATPPAATPHPATSTR